MDDPLGSFGAPFAARRSDERWHASQTPRKTSLGTGLWRL